jgi:hypothetical protein
MSDPYQFGQEIGRIVVLLFPMVLLLTGAAVAAWAIARARQDAPKKPASWERDPPYPDI